MLDWGFLIDYKTVLWWVFKLLHWGKRSKYFSFCLRCNTCKPSCSLLLLPAPSEHLEWAHLSECDLAVGCCRWAGSWNKVFPASRQLLPTWATKFKKKPRATPLTADCSERSRVKDPSCWGLSSGIKGIIWEAARTAIGWADATKRVMC